MATLIYVAFAALELRAGFGGGGTLPRGTNAGDYYLDAWFFSHRPLGIWLFPFTDWGQPFPGFTGPTLLTPAFLWLDPTVVVRLIEFGSYAAAGLGVYWVIRELRGTWMAATAAGVYYMVMVQTAQFLDGHVAAMISLALAPPFLFVVYRLITRPTLRDAIIGAVLLYLLASIGDLGILYFVLFFAILIAGAAAALRWREEHYRFRELLPIFLGLAAFLLLALPWLIPYALGARPEYTTNITVQILPFAGTAGGNLVLSFAGVVGDTSYLNITYGLQFFWFGGLWLLPLFWLIPVALGFYAFSTRNLKLILLYVSALFAVVLSTGPVYPVLSPFNAWLYAYVPYFDSIPALFRWVVYALMANAILLGKMLSDVERDVAIGGPWIRYGFRRWIGRFRRTGRVVAAALARRPRPSNVRPGRVLDGRRYRRIRARGGTVVILGCVAIVAIVLLQNSVALVLPPGLYTNPAEYSAAFTYLHERPLRGGTLMVPFSGIYELGPWCGICSSGPSLGASFTGSDTVIFQAGTPSSLALDRFVGDGLTYAFSKNMSKFLAATNVQYLVATNYTNWSYVSGNVYPPERSYDALVNQSGLGAPVFSGGQQKVYQISQPVGNVSFHRTYYVYYGPPAMLYQVLSQSWYDGTNAALVDGSTYTGNVTDLIQHTGSLLVGAESVMEVPPAVWNAVSEFQIPVQIFATVGFASPTGASPRMGLAVVAPVTPSESQADPVDSVLLAAREAGMSHVDIALDASCRPAPAPTLGEGMGTRAVAGGAVTTGPPSIFAGSDSNTDGGHYSGAGGEPPAEPTTDNGTGKPVSMNAQLARSLTSASPRTVVRSDVPGSIHPDACVVSSVIGSSAPPRPTLPSDSYYGPQPDPTDATFPSTVSGWGVLQLAQTYSNTWRASGPVASSGPIVSNVGLVAWFLNITAGSTWHLSYHPQTVLEQTLVAQGVLGVGVAALATVLWVRRRRRAGARRKASEGTE